MTDQMIRETIEEAVLLSIAHKICWNLSNGTELRTAVTAYKKEELKEEGYWVAAIYEYGHQIDL